MNIEEITRQQSKAESLSLYRLNRELLAISSCKKTLLRAEDEETLLGDICRIICDEAGYRLAWAGYVENDPAKSIRIVASAGVDEGYLEQAKLTWDDTARGRGPAGTAVRTGESACIQDFKIAPQAEPWRESALQRGYRSTLALPLRDNAARVFGVILIYSTIPNTFTPDEIRLLKDLVDDLVFGIQVLRTRRANAQAQQRIALQGFALNSIHEAALMVDEHARLHYANDELCRILGYTHDELLRLSLPDIDPDSPRGRWHSHWQELKRNRSVTLERRLRTRDGVIIPVEMTNNYFAYAGLELNLALLRDITERKKVEQERQANFHYFKSMDQVNRAIQQAGDLHSMMRDVLDLVLSIFACDRTYLLYPCDPDADTWTVPMECRLPGCPDLYTLGQPIPMTAEMAESFRISLRTDGPAQFGPGTGNPLPPKAAERFAAKNVMSMIIRPKVSKPWRLGILQCAGSKNWTKEDERLFEAIGRRLSDSLDSFLTLRDLKKSEERYRRVITTANEGILMLDENGMLTFVNARLAEMLGYRVEEMLGLLLSFFMFEEDLADHRQETKNRQQAHAEQYERRLRHKDGQVVWARISVVPIVDEEGRFNGSFAMLTDITEKKHAEEELLRINEELEQRVQRRTGELQKSHTQLKNAYRELQNAHSRLLQQEKMAAIGQLAAGIAHEINTPTQFVGGNISFLQESFHNLLRALELCRGLLNKTDDNHLFQTIRETIDETLAEADLDFMREEVFQALEECQDGVNRITRIVSAMKDFAQTGGGSLQPVELAPLIHSTVEISRNQWKKVASLATELDPALPTVYGIRNELGVVLLNLVANATHAIGDGHCVGEGRGYIRIVTRRNGDWAEILVQDNGCGIPEELQQKIFEPFFTTREVGKGSGQGLAIAYNIITGKHHGELLVDSEQGKGTTFTVRLPLERIDESTVICAWP